MSFQLNAHLIDSGISHCHFRFLRQIKTDSAASGSLHISGKLDTNPPLPLVELPDAQIYSTTVALCRSFHCHGASLPGRVRYQEPFSLLHDDGHKVIPSSGGREDWGLGPEHLSTQTKPWLSIGYSHTVILFARYEWI
jgi:hypothetical protein